jgi:hypothetical protein
VPRRAGGDAAELADTVDVAPSIRGNAVAALEVCEARLAEYQREAARDIEHRATQAAAVAAATENGGP